IGGFAWSLAEPPVFGPPGPADAPSEVDPRLRNGRIICSGLRPGGYSAVNRARGETRGHYLRGAASLDSAHPRAWHAIEPPGRVCMRRRRRVDVTREGGDLVVDAHFRDSMWRWDGVEMAVHEYCLATTVDAASRIITAIEATPRVLPFPECPWA